MVATVSFNPVLTTNAAGSFNTSSGGLVQGVMYDDPAIRYALKQGWLLNTETLPMWGGVLISSGVPGGSPTTLPGSDLGTPLGRATSIGSATSGQQAVPGIATGFTVFNQDHSMIQTPQSPVPLAGSYMGLNWFAFGSNARIAVGIDPVLADLETYSTSSLVSWDFSLQRLIPYVASYPANVFTALTRALTSGVYVATATTTTAHGIAVGSDFTVSGCVPTAYNGTWTAITGTTGSTLVWSLGTTTDPGAETTLGTLVAGGGALPCKVLRIEVGNSMTVNYNATTNFATWNYTGSCAIIQI